MLVLLFFSDLSNPFAPGVFDFDTEDCLESLLHSRQQLVVSVGEKAEPVPMDRVPDQPKVALSRLLIARMSRLGTWAPVPFLRSTAAPFTDGPADDD